MQTSGQKTVAVREGTHGAFEDTARTSRRLKSLLQSSPNWADLPDELQEALDMIAVKLARICHGDPLEPDHWRDISGYSELALEALTGGRQDEEPELPLQPITELRFYDIDYAETPR